MKKYILSLIIFSHSLPIFSQSVYELVQGYNIVRSTAKIQESVIISQKQLTVALERAYFQSLYKTTQQIQTIPLENNSKPLILVKTDFTQDKCKPTEVYGGYNYLKLYCSMMDKRTAKAIRKANSYNGVHHVVNQSTIRVLYHKHVKTNENLIPTPTLQEMLINAPAILHPMHNNKTYASVFHYSSLQLQIYEQYGVEGIILDFFLNINNINKLNKLPQVDPDVIRGTLLQGELWAKTYGLKWK